MIKVTVELVSANSGDVTTLGIATISNDGTGTNELGNYDVTLSKWAPKEHQTWRAGTVTGFNRRTRGAWDLLYLALYACVGPRNDPS